MVERTLGLEEKKHEQLRELSERTRIPASALVREGIDIVLSIAERQWRMVEEVQRRIEGESDESR